MPKSLHKVQKHITKKKGKNAQLHENSRDSRIILRANARDQRVRKVTSLREKANRQYLDRVKFIKTQIFGNEDGTDEAETMDTTTAIKPFSTNETVSMIDKYISRHDDEFAEIKASRRSGRPASSREEALKKTIEIERTEFESGFWVPDLADKMNLETLKSWNGQWVGLNTMKFVRVAKRGEVTTSVWPPRGNS